MALTATEIYKLGVEKLREICSERGLDSEGPVRLLRQRLADHSTTSMMAGKQVVVHVQASVQENLLSYAIHGGPQIFVIALMWAAVITPVSVFVELLRQVPSLSWEVPGAI